MKFKHSDLRVGNFPIYTHLGPDTLYVVRPRYTLIVHQ